MIDDIERERYLVVDNNGEVSVGWQRGWNHYNAVGSPTVTTEVKAVQAGKQYVDALPPLELDTLWPDTEHYEQNYPGIMAAARDIDGRQFKSWLAKAFWLNHRRVPFCPAYLLGCAIVKPESILELGTGGDSAHSTGMFHYYFEQFGGGQLVSVDRHPLSRTWPRYRACADPDYPVNWTFIQGDSVRVLHSILDGRLKLPMFWGMIFIDSSHLYPETMAELNQCSQMTNAMLLDDFTTEGVWKALQEWLPANPDWLRMDLTPTVMLLERHPKA